MAQTPRDDLSRRWLDKFNVDSGACRVFLGLRPDQQEALRRMGGLGQSHPSGVLMKRIRRSFGFVDLDTLMASDDFDQRSRSPALRIPNTKEGTSSLGGEQQGRREPQEGRHEQQGRREQQGRHEQQERREQQAGYLAEGEPGSKGGTSSIGGTSSKGGTSSMGGTSSKGGEGSKGGTSSMGGEQQGRREQQGRHEQQERRQQQGPHGGEGYGGPTAAKATSSYGKGYTAGYGNGYNAGYRNGYNFLAGKGNGQWQLAVDRGFVQTET
jgi:hypothetical protein